MYLTCTDKGYPERLGFSFLNEVKRMFTRELKSQYNDDWKKQIQILDRPYAFIKFDHILNNLHRDFADPTSTSNTARLNETISGINSVMKKNIEELLDRGIVLDTINSDSQNMVDQSKTFSWGAKKLNIEAQLRKYAPCIVIAVVIVFVFWWKFF